MNQLSVVTSTRLKSPMKGVSDNAWELFVNALSVSDSGPDKGRLRSFSNRINGYGCYAIKPLRLVDLKLADEVVKNSYGKAMRARFAVNKRFKTTEDSEKFFLSSPQMQYETLVFSILKYNKELNELLFPAGMTKSGALALMHRLGPNALEKWAEHKEGSTKNLYERTNGLF